MTSTEAPTTRLPVPLASADGALDIDGIAALNVGLRANLEAAVRAAATNLRQARGTVVTPEDTFDLTRRLVHAQEVLNQTAAAFTAAGKACTLEIEEEVRLGVGEQNGVPNGRMVVPSGGVEYVISPEYSTAPDTWDLVSIVGVVADRATALAESPRDPDEPWTQDDAREVAAEACTILLGLIASPKLKTTAVDALSRTLAGEGDDTRAGVLRQSRVRGGSTYKGVKVTAEEPKQRRR